jgi:hypothetical protein
MDKDHAEQEYRHALERSVIAIMQESVGDCAEELLNRRGRSGNTLLDDIIEDDNDDIRVSIGRALSGRLRELEEQVMGQAAQHLREYQFRKEKAADRDGSRVYMELLRERNPVEVQEKSHAEWENAAWEAYRGLCARKEDIESILDLTWMAKQQGLLVSGKIYGMPPGHLIFPDTEQNGYQVGIKPDDIMLKRWTGRRLGDGQDYTELKLFRGYTVDEDAFLHAMKSIRYYDEEAFEYFTAQMQEASSKIDRMKQELFQELDNQLREGEKVQEYTEKDTDEEEER